MTELETERAALALFEELIDIRESERDSWIAARTAEPAVKARLGAMIAADRFSSLGTGAAAIGAIGASPERIGSYRIIGLIGRGGMGAVYKATRDAGDFDLDVAIKIIKPGLLSEQLALRLAAERQVLAGLNHPNIARLFDGGTLADGAPYIIMELIDGRPADRWAKAIGASTQQRVGLVITAARAVAHAHQRLIIHRDITPANVLVTADGTLKLIDFGIARAADAATTTATDVFGLGRLLTRLLPEPEPELAAIIARATADDPALRYPTADALADDLEAWRDGRVVAAMAGGRRYAIGKFVNRHRVGVAAAAVATLLLIGALGVTLVANDRAETARAEAERRFGELRSLAGFMVFDLNDDLARTVGTGGARQALVGKAQTYLSALAATPGASPDIKLEAARGLTSLGQIQGVPTGPNFGDPELARRNIDAAIAQLTSIGSGSVAVAPELAMALIARAMIESHTDVDVQAATTTLAAAETALDQVAGPARSQRWRLAHAELRIGQLEIALLGNEAARLGQMADRLDGEVDRWPGPERGSRAARTLRAVADYYRSIQGYLTDDFGRGVDRAKAAQRQFESLDAEVPNDPGLLYRYLWATYAGYGAASGLPEYAADADAFLGTTRRTIDRLIALEPADSALVAFKANVMAAEAESLAAKGRFREAAAAQRTVIELHLRTLGKDRKVRSLNRLVVAYFVLATIGVRGGDRTLACTSSREARAVIAEIEAAGLALTSAAARNRGLVDRNVQRCARGAPLSEFERERA